MPEIKEYIRQSNLIEGIDDPAEDRTSYNAWRWLEGQRTLNSSVIKRLHKMLVANQKDIPEDEKGDWRKVQVRVGNHVPCRPDQVKSEMAAWLKNWKTWTPREAHIRFETIHPFRDGNGRTGRMIMWWQERKKGQEMTFLTAERRWEYYYWFKGRGSALEQTDIFGALLALREEEDGDARPTE